MPNNKYKGISRIDSFNPLGGRTLGWFVRAYRSGKIYSKFFSDLKNGGEDKALRLALKQVKEFEKTLPPKVSRRGSIRKVNSSNTSGAIGVSRSTRTSPTGKVLNYFVACWNPAPNVTKNKAFCIDTMGKEKAFKAAVKFRKAKEREILKAGLST